MERLTKRDFKGRVVLKDSNGWDAVEKLATYEDAEEEGRLMVLPVKVGDTVWFVDGDEEGCWIDEYEVKYLYVSFKGVNRIYAVCGTLSKNFRPKDIGKTVFLTREEAEAALEKMKGEQNV